MLQQASKVVPSVALSNVTLEVSLAPELPTAFSGRVAAGGGDYVSDQAKSVWMGFLAKEPLKMDIHGYSDASEYTATVRGPGIAPKEQCDFETWSVTPDMYSNSHAEWGLYHGVIRNDSAYGGADVALNPAFTVIVGQEYNIRHPQHPEEVIIQAGYLNVDSSGGLFSLKTCKLRAAIMEYTVGFSSSGDIEQFNATGRFLSWANNTHALEAYAKSSTNITITAFTNYVSVLANANVTMSFILNEPGTSQWGLSTSTMNEYAANVFDWSSGYVQFRDPTENILRSFNALMFRAGLLVADWTNLTELTDPGVSSRQRVLAKQKLQENVFQVGFLWFAGAATLNIISIIAVLHLYYGFWRVPSRLSASPFEMALAFNSPIFSENHSAHGKAGVLSRNRKTKIAYGLVDAMTPPSHATAPEQEKPSRMRVGFDHVENVKVPWKNAKIDV